MKLSRIAIVAAYFLGMSFGDVFAMNVDVSKIIEHICCREQDLKTEIWIAEEQQKPTLSKNLLLLGACRRLLVDYICENSALLHINQLLPEGKTIKDLSDTQREAIVMFESQLNESGQVTMSSPYLLAGAINILGEEKDDPVSLFILGEIIKKTPKDFLDGSDFSP